MTRRSHNARRAWIGAMALAALLPAARARADWLATGSFHYTNRLYGTGGYTAIEVLPIRFADVEIVDALTGEVLAAGSTGLDGGYALQVPDGSTRSVTARALAGSAHHPTLRFQVVDQTLGHAIYGMGAGTLGGHAPGQDVDFGAVVAPASIGSRATVDPTSMAFNVFDAGVLAADWVAAMTGSHPERMLTVTWAKQGGRLTSFFGGSTLFLADDDGYDDPNILHEIGHSIESQYSRSDHPGGTHYLDDGSQDVRLAWSEGFATFVSGAVLDYHGLPRPELYVDRDGFSAAGGSGFDYSLEVPYGKGAANERSVNAALWDIIDSAASADASPGADDDALAVDQARVWAVFESFRVTPPPWVTVEAFWNRWNALGFGGLAAMREVFAAHGMEFRRDAHEPNHGFDLATPLEVNGDYVAASLYGPPDDPAVDDDFYRFDAAEGVTYRIEIGERMAGRPDPEMMLIDPVTLRVLAVHDDVPDPEPNRAGVPRRNVQSDHRARILWRAPASGPYFVLVRKSPRRKAQFNRHGQYEIRVVAIAPDAPVLDRVSPASVAPGEAYDLIASGAGFVAGARLSVDDPAITIEETRWLDEDRLAVRVRLDRAAAPGTRALSIVNPDGQIARVEGLLTVDPGAPPQVLISEVDPSGGRFELVNRGSIRAEVGGWRLSTHRGNMAPAEFVIPPGTGIAPGGRLFIHDGEGEDSPFLIFTNGQPRFRLISGLSGTIELRGANGEALDFAQMIVGPVHDASPRGADVAWGQPDVQSPRSGFTLGRMAGGGRSADGRDWIWLRESMDTGSLFAENPGDRFEDNGAPEAAALLGEGTWEGLQISPRPPLADPDIDWYGFALHGGDTLRIDAEFDALFGDLDMELFGPEDVRNPIRVAGTLGDRETVALGAAESEVLGAGLYRLRVFGRAARETNGYRLQVEIERGGESPIILPTPTATPGATPTPTPDAVARPIPTPLAMADFTVMGPRGPVIDYADIMRAPAGAWITLWGMDFGEPGAGSRLMLSGAEIDEDVRWSASRIDFRLPAGLASGALTVAAGGRVSNTIRIEVVPSATLYYVDRGAGAASDENPGLTPGAPWRTLARAAAAAGPGDIVLVRGGVYREPLRLEREGWLDAPIVFKAIPGEPVVLDGGGARGAIGIEIDAAAHPGLGRAVVSGFHLRGFETGLRATGGAHNFRFFDLTIDGGEIGLDLRDSKYLHFAQIRLEGQAKRAIGLSGVSQFGLVDSWAAHGGEPGGAAITADASSEGLVFLRTQIFGHAGTGLASAARDVLVAETAIFANEGEGVRLGGNARVRNGLIWANRGPGVCVAVFESGGSVTIVNSTIAGSIEGPGIVVEAGATIALANTIVAGGEREAIVFHEVPSEVHLDRVVVQAGASSSAAAIVIGSQTGDPRYFETREIGEQELGRLLGPGATVLAVDFPDEVFEDYRAGDLTLNLISPARNYGDPAPAPPTDITRRPRMRRGAVDAGAFELRSISGVRGSLWRRYR